MEGLSRGYDDTVRSRTTDSWPAKALRERLQWDFERQRADRPGREEVSGFSGLGSTTRVRSGSFADADQSIGEGGRTGSSAAMSGVGASPALSA